MAKTYLIFTFFGFFFSFLCPSPFAIRFILLIKRVLNSYTKLYYYFDIEASFRYKEGEGFPFFI
ncbi:MAG: hypothetical protein A3A90_01525 [Candidatus Zambryskibacteria bacterium RIFCSPLOWO2_01_FULL_35_19]|uniref:Uncharacterized protein n=1 Tax=Candidatus Zambryskibacteria bacterium RIFCSPLOWO2_01_FULL_35_19 TaxID=1802757 RepID=A0A1G2TY50_9BACT|nr:MAG: hypothetical protein A3A90_01525 [Candidatus Zambryskibacteria bacterium RIFCSPLOWO2_01_FULL_35_19]